MSNQRPDLDAIESRYTPAPIPACRVCGAELDIASMGGGNTTKYACFKGPLSDTEHYGRSIHYDVKPGDREVLAAIAYIRHLEVKLADREGMFE